MMRTAILSFAVASLLAVPGCERKDTTVPEAPMDEEADWAPPEGDEPEAQGEVDEEKAPNLSRRRVDDEV